jgi:hypothetical protein
MKTAAKLCEIVQGVQFTLVDEHGANCQALILRDALEEFFGASAEPHSWMAAYLKYEDIIHDAAQRQHRTAESTLTVLSAARPEIFRFVASAREQ